MTRDPTVLVVDDDNFMRAALRRVFTVASIPVETFASASELLATGDLSAPAVLLLDVMMPGMTGLELQATLRERGIGIPVIFLTAKSQEAEIQRGLSLGASGYVTKPFDALTLGQHVKDIISKEPSKKTQ